MKSAAEIIAYLELAMKEAFELHDETNDPEEKHFHLIVGMTNKHLLEEIQQ